MEQITGRLNAAGNITGTLNGVGSGGGGGATALTQLTDVNISNPANNQALLYNSDSAKWVNGSLPTGVDELSELNDVQITNVQNQQLLQYQLGIDKWINVDPSRALPLNDEVYEMFKFQDNYRAVFRSIGTDFSNKIIDIHFNYPMVQLKNISITYIEEQEFGPEYDIKITAYYPNDVNDMKCLFSFRDKRG